MAEIAVVLLRLVVWVGLPILLVALAVGPARSARLVRRAWAWLTDRRQELQEDPDAKHHQGWDLDEEYEEDEHGREHAGARIEQRVAAEHRGNGAARPHERSLRIG